jgi:L-amino acid N-acyltransferase YncA
LLDLVPARPLYALVAKDNAASIRVLAKCGFEVTAEKPADEDGIIELEMKLGM